MNASRLTSRYPERDDPPIPSIRPSPRARTGKTRNAHPFQGRRPAISADATPDNRAESGCRSTGRSASLRAARRPHRRRSRSPLPARHQSGPRLSRSRRVRRRGRRRPQSGLPARSSGLPFAAVQSVTAAGDRLVQLGAGYHSAPSLALSRMETGETPDSIWGTRSVPSMAEGLDAAASLRASKPARPPRYPPVDAAALSFFCSSTIRATSSSNCRASYTIPSARHRAGRGGRRCPVPASRPPVWRCRSTKPGRTYMPCASISWSPGSGRRAADDEAFEGTVALRAVGSGFDDATGCGASRTCRNG